ncbi:MAG TPA: VWA domain-containing protein [Pseudonocardia sp.]|nr:VWA domain-containing protein [Pseudonocardia sp.]
MGTVTETAGPDRGAGPVPVGRRPPAQGWVATAETGERCALEDVREDGVLSADVRALSRRIAARLSVPHRGRGRSASGGGGSGPLASVVYRYNSDDIDLDRTLDVLTERPVPEDTDIVVRERVRLPRAVVLMIDVSGSMRGEKTRIAAAAVGALAGELASAGGAAELAVVAFWKDAAIVRPMGPAPTGMRLLDELLSIPAKGLTNVSFALSTGLAQLRSARARRRCGILLSDSVHNAGPDPRLVAARFGALHVLLETDGEHDADLGGQLARLGHGRLAPIRDHRDVAPALNLMLGAR